MFIFIGRINNPDDQQSQSSQPSLGKQRYYILWPIYLWCYVDPYIEKDDGQVVGTSLGTATTNYTENSKGVHSTKLDSMPSQNLRPSLGKQTYVYFMTYVVRVVI